VSIVEFVGQSSQDGSNIAASPSRLFNLYREPVAQGGRTRHVLRSVLGTQPYASVPGVFVRDMFEFDDTLMVVASGDLYQVINGNVTLIGEVGNGPAQISRNGDAVTVTADGKYYVWNGDTFLQPATVGYAPFGSVDFLAGRTLLSEQGGARFWWSDLGEPETIPGLNFASAEQRADKIIRLLVVSGVAMLFGERSTELWSATGQGGANAFALLPGAVVDTGLRGFGLAVKVDGGVFLVGDDGICYLAAGTAWQAVSTPAVNTAIEEGQPQRCFYWEDRGHKFCAVSFSDRPAWVYDITTGEWFERGTGVDRGAWGAVASAKLGRDWIVGDNDGGLYKLARINADHTGVMLREATSFPLYNDGDWFSIAELEIFTGHGFQVQPRAAQIMLEMARDGVRFGPPRNLSVGWDGDFGRRTVFRALGRYVQAVARLSMTDPVDMPIWADARLRLA